MNVRRCIYVSVSIRMIYLEIQEWIPLVTPCWTLVVATLNT